MDISKFTDSATGELVSINVRGVKDHAFLPYALPESWEVPPELISVWAEAREILGELRGTARVLPDSKLLLLPLRQREAIRSSRLEGTHATPEELFAYEMNPQNPSSRTDPANAQLEILNYRKVLESGQQMVDKGQRFSQWFIRYLHQYLLMNVRGEDKNPGEFRIIQVHVDSDRRYNPPPPEHLPQLLEELERSMQAETYIDPLIKALMIHYQFEAIHPFRDGNGRVGRLLLALMICKHCGFDAPWLYLSEYFENHKDEYVTALFDVSAKGDWTRWIKLGLLATIETGRKTVGRIKKLDNTREDYETKIRQYRGHDQLMYIIPELLSSPFLTYDRLASKLGIAYPTARKRMEALIDMGIVTQISASRHRKNFFVADEIFRTVYMDD